jgi:phage shock protein A
MGESDPELKAAMEEVARILATGYLRYRRNKRAEEDGEMVESGAQKQLDSGTEGSVHGSEG